MRIKICCIASIAEARLAIDAGASALGLVSTMPSGPGVIPWERIAEIAAAVPPPIATFLLTCSQDADEIIAQQRRCGTSVVQICDRLARGSYATIRRALPGIRLVQVIHVVDESSIDEARAVAPHVDAILLDSGNQSLAVKELGGTGRVHDWTLSARIRESAGVPLFLAGGLRAENIAEAVRAVRPFALDVCSGVRTDGALDEVKLRAFMAAASIPRSGRAPGGTRPARRRSAF
jgi:phosphoribosylanthranilate isomerase